MTSSLIGELVAFILTFLVFTYIIGDNPAYRLAIHAFLGVAAAYITIVTIQAVLLPRFLALADLASTADLGAIGLALVPWVLAIFILFRASTALAPLGNWAMAFMVGVGAALAVGGAITGTLLPQVRASWRETSNLVLWLPSVAGTTLVLLYFLYAGRFSRTGKAERPPIFNVLALGGEAFLMVALAALYVGALAASFALLSERLAAMVAFITGAGPGPSFQNLLDFFF